jgi:hypothetical protein
MDAEMALRPYAEIFLNKYSKHRQILLMIYFTHKIFLTRYSEVQPIVTITESPYGLTLNMAIPRMLFHRLCYNCGGYTVGRNDDHESNYEFRKRWSWRYYSSIHLKRLKTDTKNLSR